MVLRFCGFPICFIESREEGISGDISVNFREVDAVRESQTLREYFAAAYDEYFFFSVFFSYILTKLYGLFYGACLVNGGVWVERVFVARNNDIVSLGQRLFQIAQDGFKRFTSHNDGVAYG